MEESEVVLLALFIALCFVVVIGGALWCRQCCNNTRDKHAYSGLMDDDRAGDYDYDVDPESRDISAAADAQHFSINRHAKGHGRATGSGAGKQRVHPTEHGRIQSSKMWLGGANPTDYRHVPVDAVAARKFLSARLAAAEQHRLDVAADATLRAANFCRSIGTHTRTLVQPLPDIGHGLRTATNPKFCSLIGDPFIARALNGGAPGARPVAALMTMTTATVPPPPLATVDAAAAATGRSAPSPVWPALGTAAGQQALKSLLISAAHPCVVPVLDVGFSAAPSVAGGGTAHGAAAAGAGGGGAGAGVAAAVASATAGSTGGGGGAGERWNVFVVREWCAGERGSGSVRDVLHDQTASSAAAQQYRHKYCHPQPDPDTASYAPKDARPLRLKYIAKWGRHVLLALQYLTAVKRIPVHGVLHSGNVLVRADGTAALTDWENTLLGAAHKYQTALVTLQHHSTARAKRLAAVSSSGRGGGRGTGSGSNDDVACGQDPAVLAFAALLFEMSAGYELAPHTLQRMTDTTSSAGGGGGGAASEVYLFGLTKEYMAVDALLHRIVNRSLPPHHLAEAKRSKAAAAAAEAPKDQKTADPLQPVSLADLLDLPLFGGAGTGSVGTAEEAKAAVAAAALHEPEDKHTRRPLNSVWRYWNAVFAVSTRPPRSAKSAKADATADTGTDDSVAIDIASVASSSSSAAAAAATTKSTKKTPR